MSRTIRTTRCRRLLFIARFLSAMFRPVHPALMHLRLRSKRPIYKIHLLSKNVGQFVHRHPPDGDGWHAGPGAGPVARPAPGQMGPAVGGAGSPAPTAHDIHAAAHALWRASHV